MNENWVNQVFFALNKIIKNDIIKMIIGFLPIFRKLLNKYVQLYNNTLVSFDYDNSKREYHIAKIGKEIITNVIKFIKISSYESQQIDDKYILYQLNNKDKKYISNQAQNIQNYKRRIQQLDYKQNLINIRNMTNDLDLPEQVREIKDFVNFNNYYAIIQSHNRNFYTNIFNSFNTINCEYFTKLLNIQNVKKIYIQENELNLVLEQFILKFEIKQDRLLVYKIYGKQLKVIDNQLLSDDQIILTQKDGKYVWNHSFSHLQGKIIDICHQDTNQYSIMDKFNNIFIFNSGVNKADDALRSLSPRKMNSHALNNNNDNKFNISCVQCLELMSHFNNFKCQNQMCVKGSKNNNFLKFKDPKQKIILLQDSIQFNESQSDKKKDSRVNLNLTTVHNEGIPEKRINHNQIESENQQRKYRNQIKYSLKSKDQIQDTNINLAKYNSEFKMIDFFSLIENIRDIHMRNQIKCPKCGDRTYQSQIPFKKIEVNQEIIKKCLKYEFWERQREVQKDTKQWISNNSYGVCFDCQLRIELKMNIQKMRF